ncbi:hypothetical protein CBL_10589 [Carabus blaptoides fortunei]
MAEGHGVRIGHVVLSCDAKKQLSSGSEYVPNSPNSSTENEPIQGQETRKMMPERKQGTDCKCHKECLKKLSPGEKNEILTAFNGLADQEKQDSYLSSIQQLARLKDVVKMF